MNANDDRVSRRDFVVTAAALAASAAVARPSVVQAAPATRQQVIAAIGDLLIPSAPGDPGYKDLEPYKITEEVIKALPGVSEIETTLWNDAPKGKFGGRTFLDLDPGERAAYTRDVIAGTAVEDPKVKATLQRVFRNTRRRVLMLYYANFPEHQWPRDRNGLPILKPGDQHQITNPNTTALTTGWDQAGFFGPLTWEEEERRRNLMKTVKGPRGKDGLDWHEGWSPFEYKPAPPKKAT